MQAIENETAAGDEVKILLDMDDVPRAWYNILPDLPAPLPPPLHPGTKQPVGPDAFEPIFPKEIIRQELSGNATEPIPEELREALEQAGDARDAQALDALRASLRADKRELERALGEALDERRDHAGAAELTRKLMFLDKLDAEIDLAYETLEA